MRSLLCVRAQVKVAAVLQGEADLVHLLRAETTGGIFQRPAARKGVILPVGALGVELVVGGLAGQAVDPDGGNGLGWRLSKVTVCSQVAGVPCPPAAANSAAETTVRRVLSRSTLR